MDEGDKTGPDRLDWPPGSNASGMSRTRKVHIKSFGCQMNVYDSHRMADTLAPAGYSETARDKILDVRHEVEIAVPGDQRAMLASHRYAVLAGIADRHRLNQNAAPGARAGLLHRTDQGGAERQHTVAVARSAFREQHDRSAGGQALDDLGDGFAGLVTARAVDEYRTLQSGSDTDHRPVGDFTLGDEGDRRDRADHQDIGPGHVIGYEQHRAAAYRLAHHVDAKAQDGA